MEERHPLITVYITSYNYRRYLRQSVESVLAQTQRDFELLLIDDGSTDGSQELITSLVPRCEELLTASRVSIVFQENLGLNRTNNVALRMARGRYIMRLDADDFLDVRALEILSSTLEKNPRAALAFPDYYVVDEEGVIQQLYRRVDFQKEVTLKDRPAHGACTMVRTDVLRRAGGYNEAFSCQDGYDLWLKLHDHEVANVGLPLFSYRQHGGNLTGNQARLLSTRGRILDAHARKNQLPALTTVGVVPVRGPHLDPRSFPLRKLGSKELVRWTLDAALDSALMDRVVVTSPDQELLDFVGGFYQAQVGKRVLLHKRDEALAGINTALWETVRRLEVDQFLPTPPPDAYCLLYIEAPFRTGEYIDKAINTMRVYDVDSVDAVTQDNSFFYQHDGSGLHPLNRRPFFQFERDEIFRRCGGLHLVRRSLLDSGRDWSAARNGHVLLDERAALQIRGEFDFQVAQALVAQQTMA